jgi:peptide/nickel transport system permease protein
MDQVAPPLPVVNDEIAARPRTFLNFSRYILARLATVLGTAVIAVYITIIIANFGGYVDEIIKSNIDDAINGMVMGGWLKDTPTEEKFAIIEQTTLEMQDAAGLNQPFLLRTFRWLWDGITLNWGDATRPYNSSNLFDLDVRSLIAEHLSRSAFIFGTTNVLVFFVTVAFSLALTRRYGSWLDRLFVTLSPLSAAPAWIYGVFLSIFLLRFFAFSTGGTLDKWPTEFDWAFVPILLRHLFPVILAVFISTLFQGVYAWRTFFLIYSSEDYVDLAQAKGLSPR